MGCRLQAKVGLMNKKWGKEGERMVLGLFNEWGGVSDGTVSPIDE